jgi:hypothetical protein
VHELFRESYPDGSESQTQLLEFVAKPEIRALLALGKDAEVRYFDTESQWSQQGNDVLDMVYAVTYRPEGEPTSFFINTRLVRMSSSSDDRSSWLVSKAVGGGKPSALGGTGQ